MARRAGLAAVVGFGVMWLAPSAGAADESAVPPPAVPAVSAAEPPATALHSTLHAVLELPVPLIQRVEPVVTAVLELPARALGAVQPVLEPVVDGVTDLVAPVLGGRPVAPLPAVPLPPVPPVVPAAPIAAPAVVPSDPSLAAPVAATPAPDATAGEAVPGAAPNLASPAGHAPSAGDPDTALEGAAWPTLVASPSAATSIGGPARSESRMPSAPEAPPVPAPTSGGALERPPVGGAPAALPRVPSAHGERFGLHETPLVSQPPPRPPVAPD